MIGSQELDLDWATVCDYLKNKYLKIYFETNCNTLYAMYMSVGILEVWSL